jgi:integrase
MAAVLRDAGLTARQRRDIASALNTLARVTGLPLSTVTANVRSVRRVLNGAVPARHDLGNGRWANVRSLVLKSLDVAGVPRRPGRSGQRPSLAWKLCIDPLPYRPYRLCLMPFARFCTAGGIEPSQVCQETFEAFARELEEFSGRARPRETYRSACCNWNAASAGYPHWPRFQVQVDDRRLRYSLRWCDFPPSLRADVEAMAREAIDPDLFSLEAGRALRLPTVNGRVRACLALASALVHRGYPPDTIRSIADLVAVDAARESLTYFLKRTGNQPSAYLRDFARLLVNLAKHWVYRTDHKLTEALKKVRDEHIERLDGMRRNLEPDRIGMTDKNRATLRHFRDDWVVNKLLTLPDRMYGKYSVVRGRKRSALIALQVALAIEILIFAPIRRKNLVEVRLDRNLINIGSGRHRRVMLYFAPDDVKNSQEIEIELQASTIEHLDRYVQEVRPLLADTSSPYLFPGETGSHKSAYLLSEQISKLTATEIGVRITAHQFRHVVGFLFLAGNPGGHEVVRRLLGHKSIETTLQFYAGMETTEAFGHYERFISERRREASCSSIRRPKTSRKRSNP